MNLLCLRCSECLSCPACGSTDLLADPDTVPGYLQVLSLRCRGCGIAFEHRTTAQAPAAPATRCETGAPVR